MINLAAHGINKTIPLRDWINRAVIHRGYGQCELRVLFLKRYLMTAGAQYFLGQGCELTVLYLSRRVIK